MSDPEKKDVQKFEWDLNKEASEKPASQIVPPADVTAEEGETDESEASDDDEWFP